MNALRKQSTDEEVIALAKSLIKAWKKLLGKGTSEPEGIHKKTPPMDSQDFCFQPALASYQFQLAGQTN